MYKYYIILTYLIICLLIAIIMYIKFKNCNIIEFYQDNSFRAGGCKTCSDGEKVNAQKTGCEPCPDGTVGIGGNCNITCPNNSISNGVSCISCEYGVHASVNSCYTRPECNNWKALLDIGQDHERPDGTTMSYQYYFSC